LRKKPTPNKNCVYFLSPLSLTHPSPSRFLIPVFCHFSDKHFPYKAFIFEEDAPRRAIGTARHSKSDGGRLINPGKMVLFFYPRKPPKTTLKTTLETTREKEHNQAKSPRNKLKKAT
jgi:hypothetical protein